MELIEVLEDKKDELNKFVAAQPGGSFLQSWEWGEWQTRLGRTVLRFKILDSSGETWGVIQLIKMPLWGKKYYLYAPYGPVEASGQWTVDSGQFFDQLKLKFPDAIFIRIEPKNNLLTTHYSLITKTPNIQPGKTLLIDLSKSEDQLLSEMHPKTRYNIKVAQKHGVEVKEELEISVGHGLYFKEAINLICETAKRHGYSGHSFDYYQNLVDFFVLNSASQVKAHLYKAVFQNQLLSAAIMIDFANTRTFLFGGSSVFHKNVMVPYLLHWQAILDAKNQGLLFYDFWGIETSSGETPGFVRFKLGFGGQPKEYGGAYDIVNNKFWYKIYSSARLLNQLKRKISG